jgi:hypothetical protein
MVQSRQIEPHYPPAKAGMAESESAMIGRTIWVATYAIEEARQRYADRRQLLRQAGACIVLSLLRLIGVHHV